MAEKKPAYIIFNNKTLSHLVVNSPVNREELLEIPGIGLIKLNKFGDQLLDFLSQFNNDKYFQKEKKKLQRIMLRPTAKHRQQTKMRRTVWSLPAPALPTRHSGLPTTPARQV